MLPRRLLPFAALSLAALRSGASQASPVAEPPRTGRNCGDPGGRFIACEAIQDTLPAPAWPRCPLCGGRHRSS
ncbi:hypothetical protein KPL78_06355 [Roseomonas sp. HJA6]|uniref:Uncharacterized protein n=1 Tax=Roseomonas alba TaxID=2846776 RepID=A0ABS7A5C8_9PROT|nr:hypothetical protein [Neoroseomonas alba]MBW6397461.1 hypothetical protein [Neoroseomonas alba]